jgi:hypothetical protein
MQQLSRTSLIYPRPEPSDSSTEYSVDFENGLLNPSRTSHPGPPEHSRSRSPTSTARHSTARGKATYPSPSSCVSLIEHCSWPIPWIPCALPNTNHSPSQVGQVLARPSCGALRLCGAAVAVDEGSKNQSVSPLPSRTHDSARPTILSGGDPDENRLDLYLQHFLLCHYRSCRMRRISPPHNFSSFFSQPPSQSPPPARAVANLPPPNCPSWWHFTCGY